MTIQAKVAAPPSVSSLSPPAGPTAGANTVVITGTALTGATAVNFGGSPATSFVVNSATQITATAPAGTGQVQVRVTTPAGQSAEVDPAYYSYVSAPTLTAVSPDNGSTAGGTRVELTGSNFFDTTAVNFGGVAGSDRAVFSDSQMYITAPAGAAGVVDVQVVSPGGSATLSDAFTYVEPASTDANLVSLSLSSGTLSPAFATGTTSYVASVGNATTALTSTAFVSEGSATLTVNGVSVTNGQASGAIALAVGANVITTVVTAGDGTTTRTYTVTVTRAAAAPVLYSMSPGEGAADASTPPANVTITGINFSASGNTVTFDGVAGEIVSESASSITVTPPARAAGGLVNMVVTTADSLSVTASNAYRYLLPPTVTLSFSPDVITGSASTRFSVTVTNPNDVALQGITIAAASAPNFHLTAFIQTCGSGNYNASPAWNLNMSLAAGASCTAIADQRATSNGAFQFVTTAPTSTGTATTAVTLTGQAGTSNTITAYPSAPALSSLTPAAGPLAGGQTVTIAGINFLAATAVTFGGEPATDFTVLSNTSISAVVPAGSASGYVTVAVTAPGGTGSRPNGYLYRALPTAPTITSPANGASTLTRPVYSGAFTNAGSTITVFIDGVSIGTVTPVSGANWSLQQPTDLAEGAHTVHVTATTPEGGTSDPSATINFTVDATAPDAPTVTSPANGAFTRDNTPTFTGSTEPGAVVAVSANAMVLATTTADGSGAWTVDLPVQSDAAYSYRVTATDDAGNVSPARTLLVRIDTQAPATPTLTAPADGGPATVTPPVFAGTGEPSTGINLRFNGDNYVSGISVDGSGDWSFVFPDGGLATGVYVATVTNEDYAGNVSAVSNSRTFTIDRAPPVVQSSAPEFVDAPQATSKVFLVIFDEPISAAATADFALTTTGSATGAIDSVAVSGAEVRVVVTGLAGEGTIRIDVRASSGVKDTLGNGGGVNGFTAAYAAGTVHVVDTQDPAAATLTAPADGAVVTTTTPIVTGMSEPGATVTLYVDDTFAGQVTADSAGVFSLQLPAQAEGLHRLQFLVFDAAGNSSGLSSASTFTIDATAPATPTVASPVEGATISESSPILSGTAEPNADVLIVLDGVTQTVTADSMGAWTYATAGLTEGPHGFTVQARDAAGFTSPVSTIRTFTIDTGAPPAPVISTPTDGTTTSSAAPLISGTAEAGSTVTLKIDGKAVRNVTADASGGWSFATEALSDGPHSVSATAADGAGNVSPASSLITFTVDATAPASATIIAPADGAVVGEATVVVRGTAEAGSQVEVSLDGTAVGTVTADGSGGWSLDVGAPAPGAHTLQVVVRDAAGNASAPTDTAFTYSVLEIEDGALPVGQVAVAYEATITPQAGSAPFTFEVASGALPTGLSLTSGGVIAGIPTEGGTFNLSIRVTDASGGAGSSAAFTLLIAAPDMTIAPAALPRAQFQAAYTQALSASGGVAPYADWRVTGGALPEGLTLSPVGVISGTPQAFGEFDFTVAVTDAATGEGPYDASASFTLVVQAPATPTAQDASIAVPYGSSGTEIPLAASGLYERFEIVTRPSRGTVSLTGDIAIYTPEADFFGQDSFTVVAVGLGGSSAPATIVLTVDAPPPPEVTPGDPVNVPATTGSDGAGSVDLGEQVQGVVDGFRIVQQARNGEASIESGSVSTARASSGAAASVVRYSLVYRPRTDFMGVDEVSIVAFGPGGDSAPAVFTFHAPGRAPDFQAEVLADGSLVLEPTADLVGGPFQGLRIVTPPAFGEAQVQGLTLTFIPGEENAGSTFLEYVVELPFGDSAPGRIELVALAVVESQALTARTLAGVPVTIRITDDVRGGPFTEATVVSVSPVEAGEATIRTAASGVYDLTYAPQGAFAGEAVVTFTLGNGVSIATSTLTITVDPRPDPSLDPDVRGLAGSQVTTARRFADAQISNFQRRLETLRHGDNPSGNGVTLNVGFGRDTAEQDPRVELARQLRAPELDPGARYDPEREFMGQGLWAGRQGVNTDAAGETPGGAPAGLQTQSSGGGEEGGASVGVWTAGSIDWGRQNAEGQRDQRFRTQGLTIGVDAHLTDRLIVGGGVGYGRDRSEIGENGTLSRGRSLTGAVYGSWRITDAVFLDGVAGRGDLAFDSRRWAEGLGDEPDAFALGERDGSLRFVSGAIGRMVGEGSLRRSLYLRVDARTIELDAFTETGAGLASLSWDALEQDSLSASVGVAWNWRIDLGERGGLSPYARVEWSRELERMDEQGVRYADWAASPTYRVPLDAWSRDSLSLNLGAEWSLRDRLMVSAGYRGQLGDASQSHGGEFALRWSW